MNQDPEVGLQTDREATPPIWTYCKGYLRSDSTPSFSFDGVDSYRLVVQYFTDVIGIYVPLAPDQHPSIRFRINHKLLPLDWLIQNHGM